MVEREWQRHPQPQDARSDLDDLPRRRRCRNGIIEHWGQRCVHGRTMPGECSVPCPRSILREALRCDLVQRSIVVEMAGTVKLIWYRDTCLACSIFRPVSTRCLP